MFTSIVLFLTICVNIVLLFLILTHTKPSQPGRVFIWLLVSMSLWILGEAIIDLPGTSKDVVIFCARAMHVAGGCGLVAWIWFCHDITNRARWQRPLLWILSLLGLPWGYLAWTTQLIADSTRQPWGDYLVTGPFEVVYMVWVVLAGGAGTFILVHAALRARGHSRAQLVYIIAGMVLFFCVDILTCFILPIFFSSMVFSRLGPLTTVLITTTMTYAIIRYRLMDIRIVLRTGLTFLLTGISTLLISLLFLQTVVTLLHLNRSIRFDAIAIILILGLSMVAHPIWRFCAYLAGNFFIRPPYNAEATLERMSIQLAAALERQTVIDTIAGTLLSTIRPLGFRLFLANHRGSTPWQEYRFGEVMEPLPDSPLVESLLALGAPTDDIMLTEQLLWDPRGHSSLGKLLQEYGIALACPMTAQGKVNGLLCLAEKVSGDNYTDSDILLIRSMANYVALAWESTLAYEAIQEMNQQLEYRVQERTNALVIANEQLHQANQSLKEADKAKDEFLAYLSHELLTPLTSILGWVELAEARSDPAITDRAISVIHRNALRQRSLVNELLFISRLIHHRCQLECAPLDFRQICLHAFESFECLVHEKRIGFDYTLPEHPIMMTGDATRLQQALENLLKNALKFTEPGGLISITVCQEGETILITVRDTGQGIDPAFLAQIFKPFTQAQRDERHGGLGLGLALVKGIIELHGGSVTAESDGLGHGSLFSLTLPLHPPRLDDLESADPVPETDYCQPEMIARM